MDRKKLAKRAPLGIVALIALSVITACGTNHKATEHLQDSKIQQRYKAYVQVYDNADGFSNVSEFCDTGGNMVVVPFHNDGAFTAVAVIPNDKRCAGLTPPRRYQ